MQRSGWEACAPFKPCQKIRIKNKILYNHTISTTKDYSRVILTCSKHYKKNGGGGVLQSKLIFKWFCPHNLLLLAQIWPLEKSYGGRGLHPPPPPPPPASYAYGCSSSPCWQNYWDWQFINSGGFGLSSWTPNQILCFCFCFFPFLFFLFYSYVLYHTYLLIQSFITFYIDT